MPNNIKKSIDGFLHSQAEVSEAEAKLAAHVPKYSTTLLSGRPPHILTLIMGGKKHEYEATKKSIDAQDYPHKSTALTTLSFELSEPMPRDTDYIIPLIAGDTLYMRALTAFALEIAAPPPPVHGAESESIFIYGDETLRGQQIHKRGYSEINTLTSPNVIGRPFAMRIDIFSEVLHQIRCNSSAALSLEQFALEAAKRSDRRVHIALALAKTHEASAEKEPPKTNEHELYFTPGLYKGSFRARRKDAQKQRVTAIIPLGSEYGDINEVRLLLESLEECAMHDKLQTHIVTSPLATSRQRRYLDILQRNGAARHIQSNKTELGALMNEGARFSDADALLFILPGLEAISPELTECLLDALTLPNAALSAPKLLSADGLIYSAGEAVKKCELPDINELPSYIFSPFSGEENTLTSDAKRLYAFTMRQLSIASGECTMVDATAFFDAGCFDETLKKGTVAELCLRLSRRGRACVFTPYAKLICRREREDLSCCDERAKQRLFDTLRPIITGGDPFYAE